HEISYSATISNNIVNGNGVGESNGWLWDAGIQISSSGGQSAATPIAIYGNTLTNNYDGIGLLQQNRGSGALGPYLVQNVDVHDNNVTMSRGATGVVEDDGDNGIWTRNNTFSHDTYQVTSPSGSWFSWGGLRVGWSAWRAPWHRRIATRLSVRAWAAQSGWSMVLKVITAVPSGRSTRRISSMSPNAGTRSKR